jgi:tetratricopeptide (TPR) repeat protein
MGRVLFSRGNYQQAVLCFERAGANLLRDISKGYLYRKKARLLEVGSNKRKLAFLEAANTLRACAQGEHSQSRTCFLRAAECYAEAREDRKASDAFYNGGDFTRSAQFARKAGAFDLALEVIRQHTIDEAVAESIVDVCKVVYVREREYRYLIRVLCYIP